MQFTHRFDNATMPATIPNGAVVVLAVPFEHKDLAKSELGAQFDPVYSFWFYNPSAPWNRHLDPADVVKKINANNWFIGFAYLSATGTIGVRYPIPVSSFTWRDTLLTHGYCSNPSKNNSFKTYCYKDLPSNHSVIDIIVFEPSTEKKCIFLVWRMTDDSKKINFVRQISVEEGRTLWDACQKHNLTVETIDGLSPDFCSFLADVEAAAGTAAIKFQNDLAGTSGFDVYSSINSNIAPTVSVPNLNFPTPTYKAVPHKTPTNTNYALHA